MRTLKLLLLCLILVLIVVLALANRGPVTLHLLPEGMATGSCRCRCEVPLYAVSLVSIGVGMVIGYLLEWLREHKHRRRASLKAREAAQARREVERLRKDTGRHEDDVLALLGR